MRGWTLGSIRESLRKRGMCFVGGAFLGMLAGLITIALALLVGLWSDARGALAAATFLVCLAAGVSFYGVQRLTGRVVLTLDRLMHVVHEAAPRGLPANLPDRSGDELAHLEGALRAMVTQIRESQRELETYNRSLKAKICERTEELRQKNLALAFQNEKVLEASRVKSAFFANVSHELRTPLNAILALAEMLRDEIPGGLNADQRKHLGMMYASAENLLNLINDVLDLSRIEAGKMELRRESVPIVDRLLQTVEELRPLAREKGLDLQVESEGAGRDVMIDVDKTRQVFLNLLGNAIKFTERGSIATRVRLLEAERVLTVEVEDTGPGIPLEQQQPIFLEFHRLEDRHTRSQSGTGLGLAICKRLIHLMGGDIWVDSTVGKGSRFAFVVPLDVDSQSVSDFEEEVSLPRRALLGPEEQTGRPQVLVVDDDVVEAGVLGRYFRQRGVDVRMAQDAAEARRVLRRERIDLLILGLPAQGELDAELLDRLRTSPRLARIPVVVNADRSLAASERALLEKSVRAVFVKGSRGVSDLIEMSLEILQQTEPRAEAREERPRGAA